MFSRHKQHWADLYIDVCFCSCVVVITFLWDLSSLWILVVFGYIVIEGYSYIYMEATISMDFLRLLNPVAGATEYTGFFIEGIIATAVVFTLTLLPRRLFPKRNKMVSNSMSHLLGYGVLLAGILYGARFAQKVVFGFTRYSRRTLFYGADAMKEITDYFKKPLRVNITKPKKNIIYILPESFERQTLGEFNTYARKSMPFVSSLTKNGLFIPNIEVPHYAGWSIAAIFLSQCGIPMLNRIDGGQNSEFIVKFEKNFKCFGDIMRMLGYSGVGMYVGNSYFEGIERLLRTHGYVEFYDGPKGGLVHDQDMMKKFNQKIVELADGYFKKNDEYSSS